MPRKDREKVLSATPNHPSDVLNLLATRLAEFTPELHKGATYLLENPTLISVRSIRKLAAEAGVQPNTLVRVARGLGFKSYEEFREPFRQEVIQGRESFPDRARWLQWLSKGGKLPAMYARVAETCINNLESLFANTDVNLLKDAAKEIKSARVTYVLGVGINSGMAKNFAHLASMAVNSIQSIPRDGWLPIDGLVRASEQDVLLAMTFKPYRREVVEAVRLAAKQGVTIIGISDTPASPILSVAKHRFVVAVNSPSFFMSTTALSALLETLIAFVIASADPNTIANIDKFHNSRKASYWDDGS